MLKLVTLFLAGAQLVQSMQVTPNSPCAKSCIDADDGDITDAAASNTRNTDITCEDRLYSSKAGQKWKKCMTCLQNSTFVNGEESDQMWFLYNMRYTLSNCLFAFPNNTAAGSTPCRTSTACGPLENAFEEGILNPENSTRLSYCAVDGDAMTGQSVTKCLSCVSASGDTNFMANYIVALGAGCQQRPALGKTVSLNDTVFSQSIIGPVDPSATPQPNASGGLAPTMIAVIIVVIFVVIALVSTAVFCCCCRRNRQSNSSDKPEKGPLARWAAGVRRPLSDRLSFQCRADMPSPTFSPRGMGPEPSLGDVAHSYPVNYDGENKSGRPSLWKPYNSVSALRTQGNVSPVMEEPPYFAPPPLAPMKLTIPGARITPKSSQKASGRGRSTYGTVPLHSLTTSIPAASPTIQSPPSAVSRASATPLSASSMRSNTALLPHAGSPSRATPGDTGDFNSPISAGTVSPLSANRANWGWPTTGLVAASALLAEENARVRKLSSSSQGQLGGSQGTVPPPPPPKSPRYMASDSSLGRNVRSGQKPGSPIESHEIQTAFAAPPRRRA